MHCAMDGDQEAANQAVSRPISEWTDYEDVARYGWELDEDAEINDAMGQDLLEAAFEKLNIDADKNEIIKIDQIVPVTVGGNEYEVGGFETLDYRDSRLTVSSHLEQNISVCSMRARE